MTSSTIAAISAAMLAMTMSPTSAFADRDLTPREPAKAAGDWSCRLDQGTVGTLSVRTNSYVLGRAGVMMSGEYQQAGQHVVITNGPLRGLGIEGGTVVPSVAERTLEFPTASGAVLSCHEVL